MVKKRDRIYLFSELQLNNDRHSTMSFAQFAAAAPDFVTKSFSSKLAIACSHDEPRNFSANSLPAVEFTVHCGPTASSRVRLVDGGDRAFQLIVSGAPETVTAATAERFFGSLRGEVGRTSE